MCSFGKFLVIQGHSMIFVQTSSKFHDTRWPFVVRKFISGFLILFKNFKLQVCLPLFSVDLNLRQKKVDFNILEDIVLLFTTCFFYSVAACIFYQVLLRRLKDCFKALILL